MEEVAKGDYFSSNEDAGLRSNIQCTAVFWNDVFAEEDISVKSPFSLLDGCMQQHYLVDTIVKSTESTYNK